MSGQAETSNKQIKNILQKMVNQMSRSWRSKLSEALWAYQMAYKMLIGMTPYQLVYGKTCHHPVELEHNFLGHQKVEHGPQGGRNKKKNSDC
jgi:hypothetical protein